MVMIAVERDRFEVQPGFDGHSSIKTTEIYIHITTKGFNLIETLMDKLDI